MLEDDLSVLGVPPSDRKKLESMGFNTLEQIAMLDDSSLGMGKEKSRALIQRARNVLCNRHLKDIEILKDLVIATLDQEVTEPLLASVKDILGAYDNPSYGNCVIEKQDNKIKFLNNWNVNYFNDIIENAKKWQVITSAKNRDQLAKEGITIKEHDLVEFIRERGFEGFWQNVFSEIRGNEILKQALSVSLFSTFNEPNHVLVIGDPASSKTFARDVILENFKDVTSIGAASTRAGLVCNLATGELGALAFSDKQLVLVDEFDKIPEEDIEFCYELLSNGKCSVHSGRIHTNIESHFVMIAFGNPKYGAFKGDPMQEINLPPTLISRFSLVIKTEILSEVERKEIFLKKLHGGTELQSLPEYYNQWVRFARLHEPKMKAKPEKLDNYVDKVNRIITRMYSAPLRRDLRLTDYARRIPFAIARAELCDVTDEILDKSLKLIEDSTDAWYAVRR